MERDDHIIFYKMEEEGSVADKNPHDIIGVKGILKVHSVQLDRTKLQIRMENEKYLRDHPELTQMINLFMKYVLDEHPENILEFAGKFFDRADLKEFVQWEFGLENEPQNKETEQDE